MLPQYVVESSNRSYIYTECGRKMVDFSAGIGVTNLGHSHPGVTAAVQGAVGKLVHMQQNIMKHRPMINLIDRLADLPFSKHSGFDAWYFWNSGAEAVEASVKLARQATGKSNIIAFNLAYHGRTYGAMALTTSGTIYRAGFGPLMSGTVVAPFPYLTQGPFGVVGDKPVKWPLSAATVDGYSYWGAAPAEVAALDTERCLQHIELILRTQSAASETAAILIEPVLGEGGYVPAPPGFLKGLRSICDKNGILLIADEVQTGFGRTGTMFASEWLDGGVAPDIMTMAKGLGNGYPISGIATRSDLSDKQPPGSMGGTYGSNAVCCAAANAVLDAFEREGVLENVAARETELRTLLSGLSAKVPGLFREVRGKGLMIGVELNPLPGFKVGDTAYKVMAECHKRDLVILACGPYDTLRFIPALNVNSKELNEGFAIFADAVTHVYNHAK